jgi:hypothetical protein
MPEKISKKKAPSIAAGPTNGQDSNLIKGNKVKSAQ